MWRARCRPAACSPETRPTHRPAHLPCSYVSYDNNKKKERPKQQDHCNFSHAPAVWIARRETKKIEHAWSIIPFGVAYSFFFGRHHDHLASASRRSAFFFLPGRSASAPNDFCWPLCCQGAIVVPRGTGGRPVFFHARVPLSKKKPGLATAATPRCWRAAIARMQGNKKKETQTHTERDKASNL